MGHGFGELYKMRGIVTYRLSPFAQKALKGLVSHSLSNWIRRVSEEFIYVVPPLAVAYIIYDQTEKKHAKLMRKNPADFENDQ